jgi:hypothetical protein
MSSIYTTTSSIYTTTSSIYIPRMAAHYDVESIAIIMAIFKIVTVTVTLSVSVF